MHAAHPIPAEPADRPRVRLVNPNSPLSTLTLPDVIGRMTMGRKALFMPTGLAIAAACVPRDWHVEIVDETTTHDGHTPRADVDLVGLTAMTTQAKRAYALADAYRALGVTVVLGGIHPSALPDEALQHADAVCRGDAETTLPPLLADWRAGRLQRVYDWAALPTQPIGTPRKDLLDPHDYLVFNPIQTTRGCPHNCSFCTTPAVFGRRFRLREIADIIEEMREAKERFHPSCFIFADDDFGGNHTWALALCEAMRPLGITWASQCDILIARNQKLLRAMRASGCVGLILGLESPHADTLSEARKSYADAAKYVAQIHTIQSHGISLWGSFIFGFDTQDWRACMDTVRFAQRADLCMSCYPILTPYPGTAVFERFRREGRLTTTDWDRYNGASIVFEPARMTPLELRHAQMAGFCEFYHPRSALRRLRVWPVKGRSWLANLAIHYGLSYYYAKKGRRMPRFRDFVDRSSRAWRYPEASERGLRDELAAAGALRLAQPYRQAAKGFPDMTAFRESIKVKSGSPSAAELIRGIRDEEL